MRGAWAVVILLIVILAIGLIARSVRLRSHDERWVDWSARADSALDAQIKSTIGARSKEYNTNRERVFAPLNINLNRADSVTLCRVYGIGPIFSSRIIKYRNSVGGFYRVDQLLEVKGVNKEVLARISRNFWIDSSVIQKISINFASLNVLEAHPYCTPSMARRIERGRMKGGFFSNTDDLIDRDILLPQEVRRFAPYLSFVNN